MSGEKLSVELEIKIRKGVHARAAAAFVKAIENLDARVEVERIGQAVDVCSIMGLMMLAASKGTVITVTAEGAEAQKALDELTRLINNKFGED